MKFYVDNVWTRVEPKNSTENQFLFNVMSVKDSQAFFNPSFQRGDWDGFYRFYNPNKFIMQTGLLPHAVRECEQNGVQFRIFDKRENIGIVLDALQDDPVEEGYEIREERFAFDYQAEAFNSVAFNTVCGMPFPRGIVNIATNGGKTSVAIMLIKHMLNACSSERPFMFIVHRKEIALQAATDISVAIGEDVGFLMAEKQYKGERVIVGTQAYLYSRCKRKDKRVTRILENTLGFVVDETHAAAADTYQDLLKSMPGAVVRVGLTGTVPKDKLKAYKCFQVTGDIVSKVSNAKLIERGVSAKPVVLFYRIDGRMYFDRKNADGLTVYQAALDDLVVNCEERNRVIAKICEKEVRAGRHVLVLVERIEHGANIARAILKYNPEFSLNGENGFSVFFTNGQETMQNRIKSLEELKAGNLDVLISTAILDEGVDVSGIDAVVYARSGVSRRKLLQGLGRGIRKKADNRCLHIYDFLDMGERHLTKHSQSRFKTYSGEGFFIKLISDKDIESTPFEALEPPDGWYKDGK